MTTLSWLIYFIGFLSNLSIALGVGMILMIMLVILVAIGQNDIDSKNEKKLANLSEEEKKNIQESSEKGWKFFRRLLYGILVFVVLLIIVPNERTLTLIAASEISQLVVNSDLAKTMINPSVEILNKHIEHELERIEQ